MYTPFFARFRSGDVYFPLYVNQEIASDIRMLSGKTWQWLKAGLGTWNRALLAGVRACFAPASEASASVSQMEKTSIGL